MKSHFNRKDLDVEFTQSDYVRELLRGVIIGNLPMGMQSKIGEHEYNSELVGYYAATINTRSSRVVNGLTGIALTAATISGADMPGIVDLAGYALLGDSVIREGLAYMYRRFIPRMDPGNDDPTPIPFFRVPLGSGLVEVGSCIYNNIFDSKTA